MLVLLVGPKGSGKSYIGRILERNFGVRFFHVEPLWKTYYAACESGGREPNIPEGIAKVHPLIREALRTYPHVCVETTGASPEILKDLLSLEQPANTLVVQVSAPLDVCLRRIAAREQTHQIPMDVESVRKVHALSVAAPLQPRLTLENAALSEDEIVSGFRKALTPSPSGSVCHSCRCAGCSPVLRSREGLARREPRSKNGDPASNRAVRGFIAQSTVLTDPVFARDIASSNPSRGNSWPV